MTSVVIVYDLVTRVIKNVIIDGDVKLKVNERNIIVPLIVYKQLGSITDVAKALSLREIEDQ